MISLVTLHFRLSLTFPFFILVSFLPATIFAQAQTASAADSILPGPRPQDVSTDWKQMVGIYGHGKENVIILERNRTLFWRVSDNPQLPVAQVPEVPIKAEPLGSYALGRSGLHDVPVSLQKQDNGNVTAVIVGDKTFARSDAGSDPSRFYRVSPVQPVAELLEKALKLSPPAEAGPFRKPELLELSTLDPSIHLDIRYASARNFLSTPVYTQARAFMQRPAAEALVRVLHKLRPLGYGLLIHDAYRPWYVTKIFWEATPPEGKIFVADPQKGSKHNRGWGVNLTLSDLATGRAIKMPGL